MPLASAEVLSTLATVIENVIAPHAASVDESGRYPAESVAALAASGLLSLVSSTEVGGAV